MSPHKIFHRKNARDAKNAKIKASLFQDPLFDLG